VASKEQALLAEEQAYIPERVPGEKVQPKPKSRVKTLQRMLAALVVVNVVLIIGAVFLCYRLSNQIFTVEYLRRTMLETQQDIWKLNTDLEMATNEKMQQLLGGNDYSETLNTIGQR
jgi:cell division protein FtsL